MTLIRPPFFLQKLTQKYICWSLPKEERSIYLTFDDGPHPDVTPYVLDILKKFEVKATFFCIGKNAEANPELLDCIRKEGHVIGNHTWSHCNGWKCTLDEYLKDTAKCEAVFSAGIFRPPYGRIRRSQARALSEKFKIYGWSVLSRDYEQKETPEGCERNVVQNMKNGSLIVFHDSLKAKGNMLAALPGVIKAAQISGFRMDVLKG